MGMRVSDNLQKTAHTVYYSENSPAGQERSARGPGNQRHRGRHRGRRRRDPGRPGHRPGRRVPRRGPADEAGSILLTLDPAAAYAGLLAEREDVVQAVAHPCHPSVFLERTTKEEWADTFGGLAAPQNVVAAIETATTEASRPSPRPPSGHLRARDRRALGHRQAARHPRAHPGRDGRLHDRRPAQGGAARDRATPSASPRRPPRPCCSATSRSP